MKSISLLLSTSLAATLLLGCSDRTPEKPVPTTIITDQWLGQWNGPEGTFLTLAGGKGRYDITIQNLDGPRSFQGSSNGNEIVFERNGTKETLRATKGEATGMKWLGEKTNCLTIRAGEGFCRD